MDPNGVQNTDVFSRTGIEVGCRSSDDATVLHDARHEHLPRRHDQGPRAPRSTAGDVLAGADRALAEEHRARTSSSRATQEENEYVRQVMTALYGPDHPYTKTAIVDAGGGEQDPQGRARRLSAASTSRAGNATLIVVGNFDPKYAEKLVREHVRRLGHRHGRQAGRSGRRSSARARRSSACTKQQGRPAGHRDDRVPGARRHRRPGGRAPRARRDAATSAPRTCGSSSARRTASTSAQTAQVVRARTCCAAAR